jgi:hypothetical protein
VDLIRSPWGFKGVLVKFKLQVGMGDDELIAVATRSREQSKADIIVANCLEWSTERAFIIDEPNVAQRVHRRSLPNVLRLAVQVSYKRRMTT